MGYSMKPKGVRRCFYNVYSFLLYHDPKALFQMLDYRESLPEQDKPRESYFVFRYMLQLLKKRHPYHVTTLCSGAQEAK